MTRIGKGFVKRPEAASKTLCVLGNRLRKVGALRRNGSDDSDGTVGPVQVDTHAGALIEFGKAARQVSRESFLGGHFLKAAGNLTECLGPAGGGICHDGHMIPHVAVIFCQRHAGVNRGLTGGNRHVAGVGNQHRAVRHRTSGLRVNQFRELLQNLAHLVAALAASHIHNDVGVAPLGKLMLRHCFAGTESARDGCRAALGDREKRVNDTLAGDQGQRRLQTLLHGAGGTNRPLLAQGQVMRVAVFIAQHRNDVVNFVAAVRFHGLHHAAQGRRHHKAVLNDRCFRAHGINIAAVQFVARLDAQGNAPLAVFVQGRNAAAAGNKGTAFFLNRLQRALNAVKNIVKNAGAKRYIHGAARAHDRFAGAQTCRFLIHLNGRQLTGNADHFADKALLADVNHFRHGKTV